MPQSDICPYLNTEIALSKVTEDLPTTKSTGYIFAFLSLDLFASFNSPADYSLSLKQSSLVASRLHRKLS